MDTWRSVRRAALGLVLLSLAGPPLAQEARSGGGGGEAQHIIQQYQQLAAEKTSLEAQVASLKKDVDAAHAERDALKKERDALKAHSAAAGAGVAEANAARDAAEKSAEQSKQRMNDLVTHFRETLTNLKEVETDREALRGQLRERAADYDRCASANQSLYDLNGDILNRYEHVGLFTRVSANEPFTRITRARLDNLVDETHTRALELREKSKAAETGTDAKPRPPGQ